MESEKKKRHKGIIEFLAKYDQYGNNGKATLTKFAATFNSTTIKNLSDNDINNAVVVLTDVLNIGNGSANSMNFYALLQAYITVPEHREEFNTLADKILKYRYNKEKSKTEIKQKKASKTSDAISKLITELSNSGFSKMVDTLNEYSINADLYFRSVGNQQYIVFNHYNKKGKDNLQGFDCWLSKYKKQSEIGKTKASKIEEIRLGFQFSRDWKLIDKYL